MPEMTFQEALKILDIEDYGERIFKSNSHGELFHLHDYVMIAKRFPEPDWFRDWFVRVVDAANNGWARPESVFQHIPQILHQSIRDNFPNRTIID